MGSRRWCFTINNYTTEDVDDFKTWECNALTVGKEVSADGKTPHLQGAVSFNKVVRLSGLKKLNNRAHWEKMQCNKKGGEAAFEYCRKGGDVIVDYDNRKQGKRSDLEEVKAKIDEGCSEKDLWREHFPTMVRYSRGILEGQKRLKMTAAKSKFTLEEYDWPEIKDGVAILWGEPGIGKTEFSLAHFTRPLIVRHMDDLGAYDPLEYDGIVFDDMDFKHIPRTAQIHLLDTDHDSSIHIRYKTALIPAGTRKLFTTNEPEGMIFNLHDSAIKRRVKVHHLIKFF